MKLIIATLILFLTATLTKAGTFDGQIFFKGDITIHANEINLNDTNLDFKGSYSGESDTVDLTKVDYLLVNDGTHLYEGAGLGAGVGMLTFLVAGGDGEFLSYFTASTIIGALCGAALVKQRRINIVNKVDTSFLDGVNIMPLTNVVNYQLINLSIKL